MNRELIRVIKQTFLFFYRWSYSYFLNNPIPVRWFSSNFNRFDLFGINWSIKTKQIHWGWLTPFHWMAAFHGIWPKTGWFLANFGVFRYFLVIFGNLLIVFAHFFTFWVYGEGTKFIPIMQIFNNLFLAYLKYLYLFLHILTYGWMTKI